MSCLVHVHIPFYLWTVAVRISAAVCELRERHDSNVGREEVHPHSIVGRFDRGKFDEEKKPLSEP